MSATRRSIVQWIPTICEAVVGIRIASNKSERECGGRVQRQRDKDVKMER